MIVGVAGRREPRWGCRTSHPLPRRNLRVCTDDERTAPLARAALAVRHQHGLAGHRVRPEPVALFARPGTRRDLRRRHRHPAGVGQQARGPDPRRVGPRHAARAARPAPGGPWPPEDRGRALVRGCAAVAVELLPDLGDDPGLGRAARADHGGVPAVGPGGGPPSRGRRRAVRRRRATRIPAPAVRLRRDNARAGGGGQRRHGRRAGVAGQPGRRRVSPERPRGARDRRARPVRGSRPGPAHLPGELGRGRDGDPGMDQRASGTGLRPGRGHRHQLRVVLHVPDGRDPPRVQGLRSGAAVLRARWPRDLRAAGAELQGTAHVDGRARTRRGCLRPDGHRLRPARADSWDDPPMEGVRRRGRRAVRQGLGLRDGRPLPRTGLLAAVRGRHPFLAGSPAAVVGPYFRTEIADWLADRVDGVPADSGHERVTRDGHVEPAR